MSSAVLFDKDGTLLEDVPMNVDPAHIRLTPGADVALQRLSRAGYEVGIVSNQPGVALGCFTEQELAAVERHLRAVFDGIGASFGGFFYCPHHPRGTVAPYRRVCDCRKPAPGLVARAATALNVDPRDCWVVGDILDDVEAAHRAGARAILFDSGGETEWLDSPLRRPDFTTRNMGDVAAHILADARRVA